LPFSVNIETSDCAWNSKNQVVTIGLQGRIIDEQDLPASNLVFLIDVSGSMSSYNKLPLIKASLEVLIKNMRPIDKIAIVTYAGSAGVKLESTSCTEDNKEKIMTAITELYSGGSTAGAEGINKAYSIAVENYIKTGNNRVILLTDGDFNVGTSNTEDLVKMIELKRESGVYLSLMGFGMGNYNDEMMEKLSNAGNGNYAYIDDIDEATKIFDEEFSSTIFTIAKDVKIQIEFNPVKVKAYRLIGYENRMLASEDFENDAIDAGEIGAGHTVTAMYEIIPAKEGENTFLASLDDFQSIVIDKEELMTIKLRYKKPDEDISNLMKYSFKSTDLVSEQSSDNMKFITAIVEFGMILRNSAFKSESDYDNVIKLAKEATNNSTDSYKLEFIELVEKAKNLDK
jgi:Ca-activated chloride channel family protein